MAMLPSARCDSFAAAAHFDDTTFCSSPASSIPPVFHMLSRACLGKSVSDRAGAKSRRCEILTEAVQLAALPLNDDGSESFERIERCILRVLQREVDSCRSLAVLAAADRR